MTKNRYVCRLGLVVIAALFSGDLLQGHASSGTGEDRPRIIAFGDSLTAGLGVTREEAYPAQLQRRLEELGFQYQVINAGVSGETTAGGLRRVTWVLSAKPEIVILELGANDGLRGLGLDQTRDNLANIIRQLLQAHVTVILAGMKLPPNYGEEYTKQFESLYPALATQYRLPLIPFFLEGVAAHPALNQADGIHPTAEGYKIVAEQVLKVLIPVLEDHQRKARKTGSHPLAFRPPSTLSSDDPQPLISLGGGEGIRGGLQW
ncbi:MAG: arylesterase [Nitrospira sp.]|nr:arylesterase [Nitrospira sp.]